MTSQSALWGGPHPHLPLSIQHVHSANDGKKAPGALQLGLQGTWTFSLSEILLDAGGDVHWASFTQGHLPSFKGIYFFSYDGYHIRGPGSLKTLLLQG